VHATQPGRPPADAPPPGRPLWTTCGQRLARAPAALVRRGVLSHGSSDTGSSPGARRQKAKKGLPPMSVVLLSLGLAKVSE
jgi:hypothetical protein